MGSVPAPPRRAGPVTGPALVYDGECGFCTASARRLAAAWRTRPVRLVAWQELGDDGLAGLGLSVDDVRDAAWWVDEKGRLSRGHAAVAHSLIAAGGWRAVAGRTLLVPPVSWGAAVTYGIVARRRHRLPGGTPACRV